jgi:hypothetical protein
MFICLLCCLFACLLASFCPPRQPISSHPPLVVLTPLAPPPYGMSSKPRKGLIAARISIAQILPRCCAAAEGVWEKASRRHKGWMAPTATLPGFRVFCLPAINTQGRERVSHGTVTGTAPREIGSLYAFVYIAVFVLWRLVTRSRRPFGHVESGASLPDGSRGEARRWLFRSFGGRP